MRRSTRTYLLSPRSLRAYLQIILTIVVEAMYRRSDYAAITTPNLPTIFIRLIQVVLLLYPLVYFGVPLLTLGVERVVKMFATEKPQYPCPVCGYDIRETPHRCPECGTKLRWGQLP